MLVIVQAFISPQWENEEQGFFFGRDVIKMGAFSYCTFTATLSIGSHWEVPSWLAV